ncbi:DUF5990 family protein [Streptomyces spiramyceticus]|uniref:DUF5990 family protein n=1 Tax=Streptomyces spiramyceticus TaxID=299717 RepID=UPI00237BB2C8|nr:DUF5990 family protein [Streptomyces spiramyceticus]
MPVSSGLRRHPVQGQVGGGCPTWGNVSAYRNIHVAVQRRDRPSELLDPQPGDAASATWTLECTTVASPTGLDVKGRYVQGPPGGRYIYLSSGAVDEAGAFTMFRRAKLMLDAVPDEVLDAAARDGLLFLKSPEAAAKSLDLKCTSS